MKMRFEVAIPCRDGLLWRMDGVGVNTPELGEMGLGVAVRCAVLKKG